LPWQHARLGRSGVDLYLGRTADAESVLAAAVDVVAIATGARARRPQFLGHDSPTS